MKKVLIPTKLDPMARTVLEEHGGYHVVQDEEKSLDELIEAHSDTYVLIVRSERITKEVIDSLPSLKVIIRAGAGYNTIDTKYARQKGIDVMNTPGANANAVVELAIAMMLADARHVIKADPSVRSGQWEKKKFMGRELAGKTIGVMGLGAIGKLLVRRLRGFDVRVLGYDPVLGGDRARDLGVELVEIPTLFEQSDYVSLHIPENDQTRNMIDASLLGLMKVGATLINTSRSGVINEEDLRRIKPERKLRFLNDVYPKDEAGPKSVADIADVMLPHLGASTREANVNAARRAAEQLIEYDEKGISSYVVNRDIPAGLDEAFGELSNTLARLCRHALGREVPLKLIETSFYGSLKPYSKWLILPITAALNKDFDRTMDYAAALLYLKEMGVEYIDRETDESKGYNNSITIDMTGHVSRDEFRHASVRGTVAEGNLMISRINDFDKLYFEPKGHCVVFTYRDRPGVLGRIAASIAGEGINIDDVRNPHNTKADQSLALLKVNKAVPRDLVDRIAQDIEAHLAFHVEL